MNYEKAYKEALERAKYCLTTDMDNSGHWAVNHIFPELAESEDEKMIGRIIEALQRYMPTDELLEEQEMVSWLEKQGENRRVNFDEAEKEKYDFVSGQYIQCRASFNEFKEDNSYWLEYIGNDTYIGRSDNILNQKFHITPRQLYRLFTQQHFYKEDNTNDETNAPTGYGKYVDECLNEASKHFFSKGEDKFSVADLFYAGVRCGKSWIEKQCEKKSVDVIEPKFKVGDWITDGQLTCKVLGITCKSYELHLHNDDYSHFETDIQSVDKHYHLWTIQDAKDGDVLVHNGCTFIFMGIKDGIVQAIEENILEPVSFGKPDEDNDYHPATKEQRDLLFAKMKEDGYEWNEEKKVLSKIEKQTPKSKWTEEDEKNWREIMYVIEENKDTAPDYDIETYDAFISWLNNIKQRMEEVK